DHPLRDHDRCAGCADGRQDRLAEARRLCRFACRRRQPAEAPKTVSGARPAPFDNHEGWALPQEPAALSAPMSQQILFKNFELLEPSFGELRSGYQLLVEGDTVKELSQTPIRASEAAVIDCGKRTLMPGL